MKNLLFFLVNSLKKLKKQVNGGSPAQKNKQSLEQFQPQKILDIVETALQSKGSDKPLKEIGQSQFNDDGSVSYIDEQGSYKRVSLNDVHKILRQKQQEYDIKVRSEGTTEEKAAYAVADYIESILTDIDGGANKFIKANINAIENPADWKQTTLEGLSGAMQAVTGVAKVMPSSVKGIGLWSGGIEAAMKEIEQLRTTNPKINIRSIYHAVKLLTKPVSEEYIQVVSPVYALTEKEIEISRLTQEGLDFNNMLVFLLEAHLAAKGIKSLKDIASFNKPNIHYDNPNATNLGSVTLDENTPKQNAERDAKKAQEQLDAENDARNVNEKSIKKESSIRHFPKIKFPKVRLSLTVKIIIASVFGILLFANPSPSDFKTFLESQGMRDLANYGFQLNKQTITLGRKSNYLIFSIYQCNIEGHKPKLYFGILKNFYQL